MKKKRKRAKMEMGGGESLSENPFGALESAGLGAGPAKVVAPVVVKEAPAVKKRGRVELSCQKSGRGGKNVTVISNWEKRPCPEELKKMAKDLQKKLGVGGAVKFGAVEIQGDKRDQAEEKLTQLGFRCVRTGG